MTSSYGLGTFSRGDGQRYAGIVVGDVVTPLASVFAALPDVGLPPDASLFDLLQDWDANLSELDRLAVHSATQPDLPGRALLTALHVHPPIDLPQQIFCTGANYRQHVIDLTLDMGVGPEGLDRDQLRVWAGEMMDERAATGEPYVFTKPVSSVAGAFDPIVIPANTCQADWELELAVIIGTGGYRIGRDQALSHVAGYAIVNDLTARDLIARNDYKMLGTDWLRAKGQIGFLPFGPYMVPAHFIADPHDLQLRLTLNGAVMQNESSSDMIFGIARQIEYISSFARLLPGDVICTGSPAGNGTHYGRYLQPGDELVGEITGLGAQRALCVAGDDR